ncbi:MAG: prephenate dehydratase [Moorella humiferrea]|uniref:prephenate dehydratase n=1 Tax=Neomoorella humiferrea TaxID=676965 RepID=UPI0019F24D01|nr:prephenate dehydratase [Moorella humiferrea]
MKTIAYLGPPGTFSHEAAVTWRRRLEPEREKEVEELLACPDLPGVVDAVKNHRAMAGILPVENSIEGAVNLTLDLLLEEMELQIIGEVILPINHCLLSQADDINAVREVWSHPQALAQCRRYLAAVLPWAKIKAVTSTAEAAGEALKRPDLAAIASSFAASLYRLPILAQDIQDYSGNKTRFWVVGREAPSLTGPYKTSLVVAAPANRPGTLYTILKDFAEAGINLTRIESRPTKKELGEYLFFIDCEGRCDEAPLNEVLAGLKSRTVLLRILGTYALG